MACKRRYSHSEVKDLVEKIKVFNAGAVDKYLSEHVDRVFNEWIETYDNNIYKGENMDYIKESDPVGVAHVDENIENFIKTMAEIWNEDKEISAWWKIWERISISKVTNFLLAVLDDLIAYVDDVLESGPDKKATVLAAIDSLYDIVIIGALPIWLKPFSSAIKKYVIQEMISPAIDWIVDKYRNGEWRKKTAPELAALWADMGHTSTVLPK